MSGKKENKRLEQEKGLKFDGDKPDLSLLPREALEEISKVLMQGELKYGRYNWKKGISYNRLLAAALRHIHKFIDGEDTDEETKTLHVANAACNLMFIIYMYQHRKELDDRYKGE